MISLKTFYRGLAFAILGLIASNLIAEDSLPPVTITRVEDLSQLAIAAGQQKKLIMLEVAASYCSFCEKLEEEIIKPMLRSGDYTANVLIRKFEIDDLSPLKNFKGIPITGAELAKQWGVQVTPTLIFLDSQNQEVSERIVGVNSLDLFGAYVDEAIEKEEFVVCNTVFINCLKMRLQRYFIHVI